MKAAVDRSWPPGRRARAAFDRVCPPGFRAVAALAAAMAAVGVLQLIGLALREEPHPIAAALLALILLGGGAVLTAFVRRNGRDRAAAAKPAARTAADVLTSLALLLLAAEAGRLWWTTGTFFPARMALIWSGNLPAERLSEAPLPMMLAGSFVLALGAMATAALIGALWTFLYARRLVRAARIANAALSVAGAVPYVATALIVRAVLCEDAAWLAAGRWLALRPGDELAYNSLTAMAPGLLLAAVALGLHTGRGLWSWLEQVRAAEEASDSFHAARLRGQTPVEILLRQALWLRRRRDLGGLLLSGFAAALLIDVLSGTLIDSFRPPGFPTYPSLGAALFVRGLSAGGVPAALEPSFVIAHAAVVTAALLLLVAQAVPARPGGVSLHGTTLQGAGREGLRNVPSAHGLPPRPALQWVLGPSGAGKTSLLTAWTAQLKGAVLVPQDPDEALPPALTAVDVALLARTAAPRGDRVLWDLLGRLDDGPIRARLEDPFTSVSAFSRGERQRLLTCLGLVRLRGDPDATLLLDEPTSAQDAARTHALLDCLRELTPARFAGTGSLVIATHDAEALDALLGDRGPQSVADQVLWLEGGEAYRYSVRAPPNAKAALVTDDSRPPAAQTDGARPTARWEGPPQPPALRDHLASMKALLEARDDADAEGPRWWKAAGDDRAGQPLLPSQVTIAGRPHAVSPAGLIRGGDLVVLSGPSGCGKSTLLRVMADKRAPSVKLGYAPQDPARTFPAEMPVGEVLAARPGQSLRRDLLRRWFGDALDDEMLARPIGALSEGERQRVLLAGEVLRLEGSAAPGLRLLLLDEPFAAVDPTAHVRLMGTLLDWLRASQGKSAAVLVSHSPLMDLGLARATGLDAIEWTIGRG